MTVKLLTEHNLEILSLKRDYTGSSESTLVKMPHFCESHVTAQFAMKTDVVVLTWPFVFSHINSFCSVILYDI